MLNQLDDDILKAFGVRFAINPELTVPGTVETPEMCQKTIDFLEKINKDRPVCTLVADLQNIDPHAVMVRVYGKRYAYIDNKQAPEVRGMLKAIPNGMLITTIVDVTVRAHGFFFLKKPELKVDYTPEDIGVDWSNWEINEMMMLPDEYFIKHDELSLVLKSMFLSDLKNADLKQLKLYVDLWMDSVRFNLSREVKEEMMEFTSILSSDDSREEVRQMAVDIDHLSIKKGNVETFNEMIDVWWKEMICDKFTRKAFEDVLDRCNHDYGAMLVQLGVVESMMRTMPGDLYKDVKEPYEFFSHLYYLAPPLKALKGVLSLFALRTMLCEELDLPLDPYYFDRIKDDEVAKKNGKVYLSLERGNKIDLIRIIDSLYILGFFHGENGEKVTKQEVFEAIGKALNVDLSRYDKDRSRSYTDGTSLQTQLEICYRIIDVLTNLFEKHVNKT